jgi:hypothetical protein
MSRLLPSSGAGGATPLSPSTLSPCTTGSDNLSPPTKISWRPRLVTAALLARHRAGAPLHELHVAFRELRGVKHAVVDQWLSYAVELPLPSGELHLDLRVFVDAACSLSHEPLAELDTTCRGEGRRQNPWQP